MLLTPEAREKRKMMKMVKKVEKVEKTEKPAEEPTINQNDFNYDNNAGRM